MSRKMNIFNLLFEQESVNADSPEKSMHLASTGMKARKALDSVDNQIDALILRYEASSIRADQTDLMELSMFKKSLQYLFEQEEPDEDPLAALGATDEPSASADDKAPPDPVGSEKMDAKEPANEEVPDLDIDAFATRTVRLIMNHKNLLRVEEAIINRIKHFLDEHYGDKFVTRYIEILESQFGITVTEFEEDENDEIDDTYGVGARDGATGAGAG